MTTEKRKETSFSILPTTHQELFDLAKSHTGAMSREIGWLVKLGKVYLALGPSEKEIIDQIIDKFQEGVTDEQGQT